MRERLIGDWAVQYLAQRSPTIFDIEEKEARRRNDAFEVFFVYLKVIWKKSSVVQKAEEYEHKSPAPRCFSGP